MTPYNQEEDCAFCREASTGFVHNGNKYGSRTIIESEHFVHIPSLGPIVEGHSLIISRDHYLGIGNIPQEHYQELNAFLKTVREGLEACYASPTFFEHGPASRVLRAECCLDHAHIVAIPGLQGLEQKVSIGIYRELGIVGRTTCVDEEIEASSPFHLQKMYVEQGKDGKHSKRTGDPYLFIENQWGGRIILDIPDVVPSQYLRQHAAIILGKPERWDWRTIQNDLTLFWKTYHRLRAYHETTGGNHR